MTFQHCSAHKYIDTVDMQLLSLQLKSYILWFFTVISEKIFNTTVTEYKKPEKTRKTE